MELFVAKLEFATSIISINLILITFAYAEITHQPLNCHHRPDKSKQQIERLIFFYVKVVV